MTRPDLYDDSPAATAYRRAEVTGRSCTFEDCAGEVFARALCRPHWRRFKMYGHPEGSPDKRTTTSCSVVGCPRTVRARGLCANHVPASLGRFVDPEAWTDASCTADPDLWFSDVLSDQERAKAECAACPLRDACADLGQAEDYGIWGGLSAADRRRERRLAA